MKMEEEDRNCGTHREGSQGAREAFSLSHAESLGNVMQAEMRVKQEPREGLLQHWETQWQEFLKTVESYQPSLESPLLPEEPSPWDDAKDFLASFERVAEACRWPQDEWVIRLQPALSGGAQQAFFSLEAGDREDYGKVKVAILKRDAVNREKRRQHFRHFCYREVEGPRGAYGRLQKLCRRWLKVDHHSKEQILELLILEQFLNILPPEIQKWVQECGPETCVQAVALAEDFLQVQGEAGSGEQQLVTRLEEATVSSFNSDSAPSGPTERQLWTEAKHEEDGEARLLGGVQVNVSGEKILENSEVMESDEASERDNISPNEEDGNASGNRRSPRRHQKSPSGNRLNKSTPDVANKILDKSLLLHKGETSVKPKEGFRQEFGRKSVSHQCSVCGTCFNNISLLIKHQRTHGGEKPYTCPTCGKSFVSNWNLIKHKKIHTGQKPYRCAFCGKTFFERSDLIRHERTHTGEKPFRCSHCDSRFSHRWLLKKHEKTHIGS